MEAPDALWVEGRGGWSRSKDIVCLILVKPIGAAALTVKHLFPQECLSLSVSSISASFVCTPVVSYGPTPKGSEFYCWNDLKVDETYLHILITLGSNVCTWFSSPSLRPMMADCHGNSMASAHRPLQAIRFFVLMIPLTVFFWSSNYVKIFQF